MAASFERQGIDFFLEELIAVLELQAAQPAIVIEPQKIYEAIEARLRERDAITPDEHAGREYAYSLVTRLYFLANRPWDEQGSPVPAG
ncbi:MAG: hypothetical protein F4X26_10100 [Chloroflexi bacterium]|nr:hypothetical protein [Chloroflexota bacterium]MYD66311.1 hypothetical protein [Chloroflexota bacterium]